MPKGKIDLSSMLCNRLFRLAVNHLHCLRGVVAVVVCVTVEVVVALDAVSLLVVGEEGTVSTLRIGSVYHVDSMMRGPESFGVPVPCVACHDFFLVISHPFALFAGQKATVSVPKITVEEIIQ